jgi:magnesium chelatase subunit I
LDTLIADYQPEIDPRDVYFEKEFILWGLTQFKKLSKYRYAEGMQFKDPYGSYISGL